MKFIHQVKEGTATVSEDDKVRLEKQLGYFVQDVLGLELVVAENGNNHLEKVVQILIDMRAQARDNKDFALSDKIRDQLLDAGIQLKDGKDSTGFTSI